MQLKRALRAFAVVSALGALAACGLDVLATGGSAGGADEAGTPVDGSAPGDTSAPGDGSQPDVAPIVPDPILDAGLDVNPANCTAACATAGGACDAGWCTFDCAANNSCDPRIACPPGMPCDVKCGGNNSCKHGIDATGATAARIVCAGNDSCGDPNEGVDCSGLGCQVQCLGARACEEGLSCDAGTCALDCTGDRACAQGTRCHGETCTLNCGKTGAGAGSYQCRDGITCDTTKKCEINCLSPDSCRLGDVAARSNGATAVRCAASNACSRDVFLSGAGDAGVGCTGAGTERCAGTVFCDAGNCAATCAGDDVNLCCADPLKCAKTEMGCAITSNNCP